MTDYSRYHAPVTDLFSDAVNASETRHRLSDSQIAFFHEHGYLRGVRVLTDQQIGVLREELRHLTEPSCEGNECWYEFHTNEAVDPSMVLFHALGAWRISPGFHDILWNPAFTVPASQLLGGSVRFWHDQLFCKPPQHGGVVAWHQDYSYWTRTQPMAHLTCWIGLDDSTVDNGCVRYVAGSHKWDPLPLTELAGDMDAIRQLLSNEQCRALQESVPIELKAGECVFHHPLMVHGSQENRSEFPRRATVINVIRDGVCSNSDVPLLANTTPIPKGDPLGGRFFPLLRESYAGPLPSTNARQDDEDQTRAQDD